MEEKRKRGCNFTGNEKSCIIKLFHEYHNIIANKKVDGLTLKRKDAAWAEIACKFNSNIYVTKRSVKQLRHFYDNFKRQYRLTGTQKESNISNTTSVNRVSSFSTATNGVINIVQDQVSPLRNVFDSDSQYYGELETEEWKDADNMAHSTGDETHQQVECEEMDTKFSLVTEEWEEKGSVIVPTTADLTNEPVECEEVDPDAHDLPTSSTLPSQTSASTFTHNHNNMYYLEKRNRLLKAKLTEAARQRKLISELSGVEHCACESEKYYKKKEYEQKIKLLLMKQDTERLVQESEKVRQEALKAKLNYYKNKK